MRIRAFLAVVLVLFSGAISAQEDIGRIQGIETTIADQLDAFEADDFVSAFEFASPSIQTLLGTPERFGAMVREGYPMVWRPSEVRFGPLREIAGALWQRVDVTDQEGDVHALDYRMILQNDKWRISGVQILKAPDPKV